MTEKSNKSNPKEPAGNLKARSVVRGLVDGSLLTRRSFIGQLPFFLFLASMAMFYITNKYHAESLRRNISKSKTELSDLRARSVFISSELMKLSRQTEVAEEAKKNGLTIHESVVPPRKIVIGKYRRE
jgi:hypothetical protein